MSKPKKKPPQNFEEFQAEAERFELVEMTGMSEAEVELADEPTEEAGPVEAEEVEAVAPIDPLASKAWRFEVSEPEMIALLERGEFGALKLVPWGSNYTFIAPLCDKQDGSEYAVIYKPMRGEAPLWDFTSGTLYKREYAAYLVSRAWQWNFIPPVIIRDGPHGVGTVQIFVDVDERIDFFQFRHQHSHELQRFALFDYITNNADRKAGHCLLGTDGFIWAIDHGLCFNHVPKLRTVIWDWAGEPIPDDICQDLAEFATDTARVNDLRRQLGPLLERRETQLIFERLEGILNNPIFPSMNSRRQVPWGWF